MVANDPNFADFCRIALGDSKRQVDPVAFNRCHRRHHFCGIQAAIDVLPFELLFSAVKLGFVKRAAIGQADITQGFFEDVLVKLFGADKLNLRNGGPLLDHNHQHVTTDLNADVLEQTQRKKRPDCGRAHFVVIDVADANRQRHENSAWLHPLQALNTNIAHSERTDRPGRAGHKNQRSDGGYGAQSKAIELHF